MQKTTTTKQKTHGMVLVMFVTVIIVTKQLSLCASIVRGKVGFAVSLESASNDMHVGIMSEL